MNYALAIAAIVTAIFGVLRFTLPVEGKINKEDIFKDLAHIWVGILIGATAALFLVDEDAKWLMLALAILITILEVVAFKVRKS